MNLLFFLTPKAEVAYLYDDFTLRQAIEKMEYHRYSSIPILNRKGEYVGTITEGDILWAVKRNYNLNLQDAEDMPIMSIPRKRDNKCVSVDTDMEELIAAAKIIIRHPCTFVNVFFSFSRHDIFMQTCGSCLRLFLYWS